MKALITGASSGIGRDIARELAGRGYSLILVARRESRLKELAQELNVPCHIICRDLSNTDEVLSLFEETKDENIDLLINNAGYGVFGKFTETDLESELAMLSVNISAMHALTKLFLQQFTARNIGRILNVASSAAFMPGPLFSSYYASKAYVLRLTEAIAQELKKDGSAVTISALCPGPVATEFDKTAGVSFSIKNLSSEYVAKYAVKKALAGKLVIVPGALMKGARFFAKILPDSLLCKFGYIVQHRKKQ